MRHRIAPCTFATLFLATSLAHAGSMTTFLTPVVRYSDSTFMNTLPFTMTGGRVNAGQPGIYQLKITFTAATDPGDKGWANTLFDAGVIDNAMGSNLAFDLITGYMANYPSFDDGFPSPQRTPYYGTNVDAGMPGDLKGILASIASATIITTPRDRRNFLGTPLVSADVGYPSLIGSIFVIWNGVGSGDVVLTNQQFSFTTTANTFGLVQSGAGASTGFGAVPEPVTTSLVSVALLAGLASGLAARRGDSTCAVDRPSKARSQHRTGLRGEGCEN